MSLIFIPIGGILAGYGLTMFRLSYDWRWLVAAALGIMLMGVGWSF